MSVFLVECYWDLAFEVAPHKAARWKDLSTMVWGHLVMSLHILTVRINSSSCTGHVKYYRISHGRFCCAFELCVNPLVRRLHSHWVSQQFSTGEAVGWGSGGWRRESEGDEDTQPGRQDIALPLLCLHHLPDLPLKVPHTHSHRRKALLLPLLPLPLQQEQQP